jgi:hypothetical protein
LETIIMSNMFTQGRVTGNNGTKNTLGHGEYICWEFGQYQYVAIRDSLRNNWQVALCSIDGGHTCLISVGEAANLPDAEHMALEDAGQLTDDRRLQEHEEALDAKERDDPRYASQWDEYQREMEIKGPDDLYFGH